MKKDTSENEMLAGLVGTEEKELLNTSDMILNVLKTEFGDPQKKYVEKVSEEINNSSEGANISNKSIKDNKIIVTGNSGSKDIKIKFSVEKLISHLSYIYDDLIEVFLSLGNDIEESERIIENIHNIENAIKYVGGKIEHFDPMNHLSGLESPDMIENAKKVIELTKKYYKLGEIREYNISEDGNTINIVLVGLHKDIKYRVDGKVIAKIWHGNEAIDYIYSSGSGKLSIKVFEDGKWVNKNENYKITWELTEVDKNKKNNKDENQEKEQIHKEEIKNNKNEKEIKEEEYLDKNNNNSIKGNLQEDLEKDISDFDIQEK